MKAFKLGKMTLSSIFKKPETHLYPLEVREPFPGGKGHIVVDIDTCIFCGMCQKTCPCNSIEVSRDESTWSIDYFSCVQCGSCTRACPKDCLHMDPERPSIAAAKSRHVVKAEQAQAAE